eukprot:CAMPEP_0118705266 /NCGR_PEP_ID=MMETSP0800-20121206/19772_1 /TAXON_ID=210618 ORGANISM="Striatella unipunctata, Strain CCMP2910" /NCGR_SAMPLE_ID=MMETSP0800 /ASSEMBLY_ACC=CAM_ASM_000638 /LENGTH=287 /DNA_ID=CAMNT_0006607401 /DNA_START=38 /DNA_END=901 /DNA_ORIENTATION=-
MTTRATSVLLRRLGQRAIAVRLSSQGLKQIRCLSSEALSIGGKIQELATTLPHMDCVRYEHKNLKFAFEHVQQHSEALAIGFWEYGFRPGDKVLSWLPLHFAEQHILQVACSKAGLVLYHLDPSEAVSDEAAAVDSLKSALEVTQANALISQEAGDDVSYVRLCQKAIPEIRIFDFAYGMPFVTPRFPHLRLPVHTGFDIRDLDGFMLYRHMLVPSGDLDKRFEMAKAESPSGSTPLVGQLVKGSDGNFSLGPTLTNTEAITNNVWPEVSSILKKEYIEVEGVGVIF